MNSLRHSPILWELAQFPACHLLDVVHHREKLRLGAHFALSTKRKSSHALILEVAEDWFDGAHAATVECPPEWRIELLSHALRCSVALGASFRGSAFSMLDDCELALTRTIGIAQTFLPQGTLAASRQPSLELGDAIAIEEHVLAGRVVLLPCWTDTTRVFSS